MYRLYAVGSLYPTGRGMGRPARGEGLRISVNNQLLPLYAFSPATTSPTASPFLISA
jgi:hypothetical protein